MRCKRWSNETGVTLMEVMMAVAIFVTVLGISVTSLTSFYVTMDMQEQRIEAVQSCRSVLSAMREKRSDFQESFPEGFLSWIEGNNQEGWTEYQRVGDGYEELKDHFITVACYDLNGAGATNETDPMQVYIKATWKDRKGRSLEAMVATILTNR